MKRRLASRRVLLAALAASLGFTLRSLPAADVPLGTGRDPFH